MGSLASSLASVFYDRAACATCAGTLLRMVLLELRALSQRGLHIYDTRAIVC